jgi:hypothetical protein
VAAWKRERQREGICVSGCFFSKKPLIFYNPVPIRDFLSPNTVREGPISDYIKSEGFLEKIHPTHCRYRRKNPTWHARALAPHAPLNILRCYAHARLDSMGRTNFLTNKINKLTFGFRSLSNNITLHPCNKN